MAADFPQFFVHLDDVISGQHDYASALVVSLAHRSDLTSSGFVANESK